MQAGLYVVGTPIGNLGDITARATATLSEADFIYAEDTRRTRKLLSHLGIRGKRIESYPAHATPKKTAGLVARLGAGHSVALVTDAGMPGISDPGAAAVRAARASGIRVFVVPGVSAVAAAVAASGLVDGPFTFLGFLPRRGQKRRRALERIQESEEPVVVFETKERAQATLSELAEIDPERPVSVCRELTKLHEETLVLPARELARRSEWLGELTFVIAAARATEDHDTGERRGAFEAALQKLVDSGQSSKNIAEALAAPGRSKRHVYERVLALRGEGPKRRS